VHCQLNISAAYKHSVSYCIGFVVGVRIVYAALLYGALRTKGIFNVPFMGVVRLPFDWLYLFAAWDTGYYYSIAQYWYPSSLSPQWAFFPLYPAILRALYLIGIDVSIGAFMVATIAGLVSIPLLLKVAEKYLSAEQAFKATLLYFLFPPVFVFSGASYSESVFLLLSLLSWNYHLQRKEVRAGLAAGLCTLTRPYGILVVLPLAYDFLRHREFRKLTYLSIPASAMAGWTIYAFSRTGLLAFLSAHTFWNSQNALIFRDALSELVQGRFDQLEVLLYFLRKYFPIAMAALFSVLFFVLLLFRVWKIDRALGLYSVASILVIFYFNFIPGFGSSPRLLAFIFPIALALGTKRNWLFYCAVITFLALSLVAWWAFLTDGFF
jgi:Gpi18-like mannosyltransferase